MPFRITGRITWNRISWDSEDADAQHHENQASMLLRLASGAEYFHHDGVAYAEIEKNGHRETRKVNSAGYKDWLVHGYYEQTKQAPSDSALRTALQSINAKARFEG